MYEVIEVFPEYLIEMLRKCFDIMILVILILDL